jgi:hypothetical protein
MWRVAAPFCLAVLALSASAPAHAVEASGGPPGSDRGLHRAERAFGLPACGRPAIAYASFAERWVLSGADAERCRILLNAHLAPEMSRATVCTLVMHEWGHLAGRPHSAEPTSVMYAEYVGPDERCVAAARRPRRAAPRPGGVRSCSAELTRASPRSRPSRAAAEPPSGQ